MLGRLRLVRNLLYPPECLFCGSRTALRARLDACEGCLADLASGGAACERCGEDLACVPGSAVLCGACLTHPPPFTRTFSLGRYQGALAELIRGLKFQRRLENGRLLGQLLGRYLSARDHPAASLLVPVPMHTRRLLRRGFNQAAEIARWAGREAGLPVRYDAVCRLRDTAAQTGLDARQRQINLQGAFRCRSDLHGHTVLIVDDVMTTGSTAASLAAEMLNRGCPRVEVWCAARASL